MGFELPIAFSSSDILRIYTRFHALGGGLPSVGQSALADHSFGAIASSSRRSHRSPSKCHATVSWMIHAAASVPPR